MVRISFLGACREVGRSALLIESKSGHKCVLDYGIGFNGEERTPLVVDHSNLDAIALTHCHIDHSGSLPFFYKNGTVPFFTNPVSLEITKTLVRDMIKIAEYPYSFGYKELNKLTQNAYFLQNGLRRKVSGDFYLTFFDAGHIPGSVSILVEVDGKKIFYTGDINTQDTCLSKGVNTSDLPEIDALVIESTYALRSHPNREELEKKFVSDIIEVTENGGKVLIPAFGVARSQEMLMLLTKYLYSGKTFIDGMAREISDIYLNFPDSLGNEKLYRNALSKVKFVHKRNGKLNPLNTNGVIITPSGMLKGGAAIEYIKTILNDPSSAVFLVGYQVDGSPGRILLDKGVFEFQEKNKNKEIIEDIKIDAQCHYEYYDFSSHADGPNLQNYLDAIKFRNSSKYVFCVHGDNKSCTFLSSQCAKKSFESVAPEIGESYTI